MIHPRFRLVPSGVGRNHLEIQPILRHGLVLALVVGGSGGALQFLRLPGYGAHHPRGFESSFRSGPGLPCGGASTRQCTGRHFPREL